MFSYGKADRPAGLCPRVAASGLRHLTDPYPSLGAQQDAINRRVGAQYDPALPQKPRTDNEERGNAVYGKERADEWKSFWDLFRWQPANVSWRDPCAACAGPDEAVSRSRSEGRRCKQKSRPVEEASRR